MSCIVHATELARQSIVLAGNELSGKGVGARVDAEQYGKDSIRLNALINDLHANSGPRLKSQTMPPLLAPGGFFDRSWFEKMLQVSGPNVVNILSHHMYTLGPGLFYFIRMCIYDRRSSSTILHDSCVTSVIMLQETAQIS